MNNTVGHSSWQLLDNLLHLFVVRLHFGLGPPSETDTSESEAYVGRSSRFIAKFAQSTGILPHSSPRQL